MADFVPTTTVQLPLAAIVPPVKVTVSAVVVTVPPHCVGFGGVETIRPAGNVSVKVTPVSAVVLEFVMVKVSTEVLSAATGFGEKFLLIAGGFRP